jgi:hypothetical protein
VTGFAFPGANAETNRPQTKNVASAVASSTDVPDGLDWQAFPAAYFAGRRRHDLEALGAYGAYRRSQAVDERLSEASARTEEAESGPAGSTALQDWEDEGGAAL